MKTLDEILDFENKSVSEIISDLKTKSISVPEWELLVRDYEPKFHKIVGDTVTRKDKRRADNSVEEAARLAIGLEKLLTKRVNDFTFTIPVKRRYSNTENNEVRQNIATAIEKIYRCAHINKENIKRGLCYYASCEICTVWYAIRKPNDFYGFHSEFKLKCKTYSPMNGVELYPLFDEYDDMLAMSFAYSKVVGSVTVDYFETFTDNRHYKWSRSGNTDGWSSVITSKDSEGNDMSGQEIILGKIPCDYLWRSFPVYTKDMSALRNDLEYTISRDSDTVAYNSAPVLKVAGSVEGEEQKGEAKRIYRVENGGDVSYVSWDQSTAANQNHVDNLLKFFWMSGQMPDISFEKMCGLGSIGFDARQTIFTDAHLKIGEETGPWLEFFERETNIIKAFLSKMNTSWSEEIDNVDVEHIITPFIQNDESLDIDKRMKANGGKPIESQLESISRYGKSVDAKSTLEQINKESEAEQNQKTSSFNNMFDTQNQVR